MRRVFAILTLVVSSVCALAQSQVVQPDYDTYFHPYRLRVDLTFAGDASYQNIFLDGMARECDWSGSKVNLIDTFRYGEYRLEVHTPDGKEIYSKGFNTLFQEWRTTAEARTTPQAFASSYVIPYPKDKFLFKVFERSRETGLYGEIFSIEVDPSDKLISREVPNDFKVDKILYNGDPANKVDLLFIAEGYTAQEMDKFRADAQRFADYMFTMDPYTRHKGDFNIWILESVSEESGTDIPHKDIWKRTVVSSNFYTFRSDRYLTAQNHKLVSQVASNAPYDALYVLVNNKEYGGGGIYNFYGLSASDCIYAEPVFVHEFGHSFAGLGDEYYDSSTSYEDFYNIKIEPWEPNITTKVHFESKWKDMMESGAEVGLYEGGGYMAKGIFRPVPDCRMKTNTAPGFCPVCQRAIERMIGYYTR